MIHPAFHGYYSSMLFSDSAYRCRRCGQGPVAASGGLLATHCSNCGTYHSSGEPIDLGIGKLGRKIGDWLARVGKKLVGAKPAAASSDAGGIA